MPTLNKETLENINNTILDTIGISYEEFINLDYDEQQKLIQKYQEKNPLKKQDYEIIMIGSGSSALFTKVKKRTKVLVGTGANSIFGEAGLTTAEEKNRLNAKMNQLLKYKQPKLVRKKRKNTIKS